MGAFYMKFREIKKIIKTRRILIELIQVLVGTALMAASTSLFLLPNQLSSGGFSGIATITYYLFKIPLRNDGTYFKHPFIYYFLYKKWQEIFYKCSCGNRIFIFVS